MTKVFTNEVKTGFMVIFCVAILVGLTIMAGSFSFFKEQYEIKVIFTNIAGVQKDASVRLGGVEVGKVKSIDLVYTEEGDTKIFVGLELDSYAKLREGTMASITTLGLMGETYIALSPGDTGAPFVKAGASVPGKDPISMDAIIEEATSTMEVAKETMNNISKLTNDLDDALTGNRGNIDEIMNNLRRSTENFEEFSDDIKRNPWKLLVKGSDNKESKSDKNKGKINRR